MIVESHVTRAPLNYRLCTPYNLWYELVCIRISILKITSLILINKIYNLQIIFL